jgi:CBS domain-containing protein
MTHGRFRHIPVVDEAQLVGIISIGDVVKRKIEHAEFEVVALREYITTG